MTTALAIAAVGIGLFHAVASWFFFSRRGAGVVWGLAWLAATAALVVLRGEPAAQLAFWAAAAAWEVWWISIAPQADRPWAVDVARQTTATIADGRLIVRDVRDFVWRAEDDVDARWTTRSYTLGKLESVDLFASYWTIGAIAHLIVSFGFGDEGRLAFSIEIRREQDEPWSGVGGFFKVFELVTIAAEERDVVGVRAALRGEDLRLYRLRSTPEFRRRLLAAYVADCNRLADEPRFFHTFWTNCTTQVIRMMIAAGGRLPLDWRMIVSGYLPDYLYKVGLLDDRVPFTELRARGAVSAKARAVRDGEGFSEKIRDGVPTPE